MRLLRSLAFVFGLAVVAAAQTSQQPVWHTLTSANGEFSVTVPSDYIVLNDKVTKRVRAAGGSDGAFFDASFSRTGEGKKFIEGMRRFQANEGEEAAFLVGDAQIYTHKLTAEQRFRFSIYIATRKGYYGVSTTAFFPDNTILLTILASLRLNGQPVLKGSGAQAPTAATAIDVSSLETSERVRAALQRKQTEPIVVESGVVDVTHRDKEPFYSRSPMMLYKPHAKYNDEARSNNVRGTVRLRVLLKASGDIGKISVLSGLPHGLTEQAIGAAKQIKFLPAEINGVPADAETTIEYSFTIY